MGSRTKAFVVGGTGTYGRATAQFLVASDEVTELVVGSRDLARAQHVADELGDKATAARADVADEGHLASLVANSDILVNAAGPTFEVSLPGLRAALKAGVNYCDLNAHARTTSEALRLDSVAKTSGLTALLGIGVFPGLSTLMMMYAAGRLDRIDKVQYCFPFPLLFAGDPKEVLAGWHRAGAVDGSARDIFAQVAGRVPVYRKGHIVDVDPLEAAARIRLPNGLVVDAPAIGNADPVTLSTAVPEANSISVHCSFLPKEANELYSRLGRRIGSGEIDESQAAILFYEHLASRPSEWFGRPEDFASGYEPVAMAEGTKDGRRIQYRCWPSAPWSSTAHPLALAALKILRGEIDRPGVLGPVACLDPLSFFTEIARAKGVNLPSGKPLAESIEALS